MIPLAMVLLQTGTVSLTPFVDDGGTKTHQSPPLTIPLVSGGGHRVATLRVGTTSFKVWIDGGQSAATMYVDRNLNGKIDPSDKVPLRRQPLSSNDGVPVVFYEAKFSVRLPGNIVADYQSRFVFSNTKDKDFDTMRNILVVLPDFGYLGHAKFGGSSVKIGIRGGDPKTAALFIDRDGDGTLGTVPAEMYALDQPFNIGGTTYKLASFNPTGKPSVSFAVSSKRVAERPMPPDLRIGKIAPTVAGKTVAGKAVSFPKSFAGKVVLLDVWATWCGPCRQEIPFMRDAYSKYKRRGFDIVSFSIDDPNMRSQVADFSRQNGTNWTQVYEGKGWRSTICAKYALNSIPFLLLVDGTTGKILATPDTLRGPNMAPTIEGVLAMRGR